MENPHEQVQNALLSRIINNMENLNESIVAMNKSLQDINRSNMDTEMVAQMWDNYSKNSQFNLEATGQKKDPI
ncbi:Piso0_004452 [Millerozyma farinosa CBS 7064]|uniref:DASH complex subunit DAD4 n=1 Tax=Pichia sorbitophila (strain ATCC MYA-4447 / BCRC 22081 / CBS 7064 / NBRC 10061 / NRRL Y-12695) TaxID=559304 RepID=G8Y8U7_PICSO|nr:Piso0_004452 [Millerozyma farinosa CBS 7064]CCE84892.1 Piso0_004452 [Millerozyma farinosa CBS 7064]